METLDLIHARKAVRAYTGQITSAQLQTILEAGNAAPVGMGNYGDYRLVVIQDPAVLQTMQHHYNAPTVIVVAVQHPGRMEALSAGAIVHNMELAAEDLQLGANYNMACLSSIPEGVLPAGFEGIFALTVGQTTTTFTPRQTPADQIKTIRVR